MRKLSQVELVTFLEHGNKKEVVEALAQIADYEIRPPPWPERIKEFLASHDSEVAFLAAYACATCDVIMPDFSGFTHERLIQRAIKAALRFRFTFDSR